MHTPDSTTEPDTGSDQYEFDRSQELVIIELAHGLSTSSLVSFVLAFTCFGIGAVVIRNSGTAALIAISPIFVYFCMAGFWSWRAQSALKTITDSTNRDIDHLMDALQQLRRFYRLKLWAAAAAAVLLFVLLLTPTAAS